MADVVEPSWDDVRYPNFGGRRADEIEDWADDPGWPRRYTYYAEAMVLAAEAHHSRTGPVVDGTPSGLLLEQLGDPTLAVWRGLDTSRRTAEAQGEYLIDEVFLPVIGALMEAETTQSRFESSDAAQSILAWYVWFTEVSSGARAKLIERYLGASTPKDTRRWLRDRRWPDGLNEVHQARRDPNTVPTLQRAASEGLRRLTRAIDERLASERWSETSYDPEHPFADLVPNDLAEVLLARAENLREYRDRLSNKGIFVEGIDDRGMTDLLQQALPRLRTTIRNGSSMLVIAPTSSGKSDLGRIAAAHVISSNRKVAVLLPTKALVAQTAEEWGDFFRSAESSAGWRIVEASRDHPYNDERVAKGDFDVLLAIPEKLAAYVAGGSRLLDQCGLVIVDEFQYIGQRQRGSNIESLLTILRARYPRLPLIGLSATLRVESTAAIREWLGIGDAPDTGLITSSTRPVALDRSAASASEWICRTAQGDLARGEWDIGLESDDLKSRLDKLLPAGASTYRDSIALVMNLLGREDSQLEAKSIIVFVGSRRAAERMTRAIQAALEFTQFGESSGRRSPYQGRFGRDLLDGEELERRDAEFRMLPNLPATDDLREGLQTGVMYHSARLDKEHRQIVEQAYRDGVIRVLVSTATLALGMNLPADFVIVADVTEGVGGFEDDLPLQRVLDSHDLAQRLGRCGRLGKSTKGEAFVMVPPSGQRWHRITLDEDQKSALLKGSNPGADRSMELTQFVDERLADPTLVFEYFVDTDDSGESVSSSLVDARFARLLLQDIVRGAPAVGIDELQDRVDRIYEHSLLRAEGLAKPDTDDLLDVLEEQQLVGLAPEDNARWKVTGLGRTIAFSNLSIANARTIRAVAEAAQLGAGPLTLLAMAAEAEFVRDLTWLSLPHHSSTALTDQVRRNTWNLVRAFAAPDRARADAFERSEFLEVVEVEKDTLLGAGAPARALEGRLDLDIDRVTDHYLTASLRACIAYLWMIGYPMNSIISFAETNTRATVSRRSLSVEVFPADVRDLGERISYVLNAAAEVLRVAPAGGHHLNLANMAEALQSGVPYQLSPLLRLPSPRIHRERLVALLDMRHDQLEFDEWAVVLDRLSTPRPESSAPQRRAHRYRAFTSAEREQILRELSSPTVRTGSRALPPDLRDQKIPVRQDPEGSLSYAKLADDLDRKYTLDGRQDDLAYLFEEFGLEIRPIEGGVPGFNAFDASERSVDICLVESRIDRRQVVSLQREARTLVLFNGLTPGAEHLLRGTDLRGFAAMSPWVLISALARIDAHWRATYSGDDPEAELAHRALTFFGTVMGLVDLGDVSLVEAAAALPPPPPLFQR